METLDKKTCQNCKWASCKHYGYNRKPCINFIPDREEQTDDQKT